ncbi:MAG: BBE domain-containing protein [Verrucomicrobia bacterium]|nr:BBE domain-containing protein [Verrucomicrobiota bacterium]
MADEIFDQLNANFRGSVISPATGAYVNFMMDEGIDRIKATYRDNYDRLVEIKRKYDPENFFRINQNIRPN